MSDLGTKSPARITWVGGLQRAGHNNVRSLRPISEAMDTAEGSSGQIRDGVKDPVVKALMEKLFVNLKELDLERKILHKIKDALLLSTNTLTGCIERIKNDLVKSVMEQVYTDIRSSVGDEDRDTLRKIKEGILYSKMSLNHIVDSMVAFDDKESLNQQQPGQNEHSREQRMEAPSYHLLSSRGASMQTKQFYRPRILLVDGDKIPLSFSITISIPRVISHSTSSMFGKDFVSYEICSHINTIMRGSICDETKTISNERRYREFCELLENLKKKYPMSTIPSLPAKRAIGERLKDEWVLDSRRFQLLLWLQYICSHTLFQNDSAVQEFIGYQHTNETAKEVAPSALRRLSVIHNEIQKKINDTNVSGTTEADSDNLEKVLQGSFNGYSRRQSVEAKRAYITVSRDLQQLEPQASSANTACANLLVQVERVASKTVALSTSCKDMAVIERSPTLKEVWKLIGEGKRFLLT